MNLKSQEETLKELQRQNNALLKLSKERKIIKLKEENERLRRWIECDESTKCHEILNPKLITYTEDGDSRPLEIVNQRGSTYRDYQRYGGESLMFPPDFSRVSAAPQRKMLRQPQLKMHSFDGTENSNKTTVARDLCEKTRRLTFDKDSEDKNTKEIQSINPTRIYTANQLNEKMTKLEKMTEQVLKQIMKIDNQCFYCGGQNKCLCDCQQSQIRYNERQKTFSPGRSPVRREQENKEDEFQYHSIHKDEEITEQREDASETEQIAQIRASSLANGDRQARAIRLPITFERKESWTVVSTEADMTVKSMKMAEQSGMKLGTRKCKLLNAEDNMEMVACGGVTATSQISNILNEWSVYGVPIRDDLLIRLDLMKDVNMNVLTKQDEDVTATGDIHIQQMSKPILIWLEDLMPQDKVLKAVLSNKSTYAKTWAETLEENMSTRQNLGRKALHNNQLKLFVSEFMPTWIQRQIQTCPSNVETIEEETDESSLRISLTEKSTTLFSSTDTSVGDGTVGGVLLSGRRTKDEEDTDESSLRISLTDKTKPIFSSPDTSVKLDIKSSQRTSSTEKIRATFRSPDTSVKLESSLRTSSTEKIEPTFRSPDTSVKLESSLRTSSRETTKMCASSPYTSVKLNKGSSLRIPSD